MHLGPLILSDRMSASGTKRTLPALQRKIAGGQHEVSHQRDAEIGLSIAVRIERDDRIGAAVALPQLTRRDTFC